MVRQPNPPSASPEGWAWLRVPSPPRNLDSRPPARHTAHSLRADQSAQWGATALDEKNA